MFTYIGLSEAQVFAIRAKYHIYMLKSGRISISGCKFLFISRRKFASRTPLTRPTVNEHNVGYVAAAIDDIVRTIN